MPRRSAQSYDGLQMITNPALNQAIYAPTGQTYRRDRPELPRLGRDALPEVGVARRLATEIPPTTPGGMISVVLPEGMDPNTDYATWIANPATDTNLDTALAGLAQPEFLQLSQRVWPRMDRWASIMECLTRRTRPTRSPSGCSRCGTNGQSRIRAPREQMHTYLKNYRMTLQDAWTSTAGNVARLRRLDL